MASTTATPAAGPTPEQALSALLTTDQLTELIDLISAITNTMHAQLSDAFQAVSNSSSTTTTSTTTITTTQSHEPPQRNAGNPNLATPDPDREETEAEARARGIQAGGEGDLPEKGLADLRKDALEWLQGWRDGVVGMVLDALKASIAGDEVTGAESEEAAPPDYEVSDPNPITPDPHTSLTTLYPPTSTSLSSLPHPTRASLLSAMLLLVLSKGHYAAPSRILLLHMLSSLHLPLHILLDDEIKLAQGLLEAAKQMSADEETKKRSQENAASRRWKVGLAGVAGAALIGVTGGLAAPLVAGAIGTVMGGLGLGATAAAGFLGTLGSSGVIVGSLFGAYGYGMTSKMMDQYAKEVDDFAFLPMRKSRARTQGTDLKDVPAEERRLRVTIGVSGWLAERRDVMRPWRVIGTQSEVFALKWELEALLEMGKSLESMVSSAVWAVASREILARTVFASLMVAMWPITVLKLSKIVDNPFNVAKNRADKAGLVLADAIINKAQGERPVSLIGYSMGARLIYSCLMSLAERRAFGLVESAVLIGTPAPSDSSVWRALRSVVSGRLVNAYAEKDYVLAFLYRTSSIQFGIAGLEAVDGVKGVENENVSDTVSGHLRYPHLVGTILKKIGWEDINVQEVEREQYIADMLDKEEQQRTAEHDNEAPVNSGAAGTQAGSVDGKETRPALPSRTNTGVSRDPLGADENITSSKDAQFEEALEARVATYIEREGVQKFRCLVPECQKLFKTKTYWRKHIGLRHAEWLEGIQQEVRSAALKDDAPKGEEHIVPMLQSQAIPKQEEDLLSFDEGPTGVKSPDKVTTSEGQRQPSLLDMTEEKPEVSETCHSENPHEVELSDDEESHGIAMINNEDEIQILEPAPWTEDEATPK